MTLNELVRPNILKLTPYTSARNANENSRIDGLNRYPDPLQTEVKRRLSEIKGVDASRIFLGVGSDECIDLCYRVFCRPGIDNVVAIDPTYGMYAVCAEINDVEYRPVKLNPDFSIDEEALFSAVDANTKVMWICSPNNPTGNAYPLEQLERIASRFEGITVVDEAYVDFSEQGSMLRHLDKYPRLVVMQTFSKAWASAAMRLGTAYAAKDIIDIFNNVKYPYNINILTQREAIKVLADHRHVADVADELVKARDVLAESLAGLDCVVKVYPSDANFLLVRVTDADSLYGRLKDAGVIVRNRSRVTLCEGCLRITVGNEDENNLLIEKIREYGI